MPSTGVPIVKPHLPLVINVDRVESVHSVPGFRTVYNGFSGNSVKTVGFADGFAIIATAAIGTMWAL